MYKPHCTGSLQPRRYELLMDDFIKYLEKKGENPAASFVIFFLSLTLLTSKHFFFRKCVSPFLFVVFFMVILIYMHNAVYYFDYTCIFILTSGNMVMVILGIGSKSHEIFRQYKTSHIFLLTTLFC